MNYGIYPYTDRHALLVEYLIKQDKFNITTLIKPKIWEVADPGFENVSLTSSFREAVENVDTVIFLDDVHYKDCIRKISSCIRLKTDIISCVTPKKSDLLYLTKLAQQNGVKIEFCDGRDNEIKKKMANRDLRYHSQECVVVAVGSIFNGGAGYDSELVLKLAKSFKNEGYTVTVLASDRNLGLCDFHSALPYDLDGLAENPDAFIIGLNAYYNYIQMIERSDVIILQFPQEGLLKLFDNLPCGFGIKTYIISQSIDVDYFTLVWGADPGNDKRFHNLSVLMEHRFGMKINSVAVTDCCVEYYDSLEKGSIICMQVGDEKVKEILSRIKDSENSDIVYCNYNDNNIGDIICKDCIHILS